MKTMLNNEIKLADPKEIAKMTSAIEFDGTNYYTPNGVATLPSNIDNALANTIILTNSAYKDLNLTGPFSTYMDVRNIDDTSRVAANQIFITINSLYKRLIYDINNIFRVLFEDPDLKDYKVEECEGINNEIITVLKASIKYYTNIFNQQSIQALSAGMIECLNGIGIMIYNDTFKQFSNNIYKKFYYVSNFDKNHLEEVYMEYNHAFSMFMADMISESETFVKKYLTGIDMVKTIRPNDELIDCRKMLLMDDDIDNTEE